jgi:hypothetical protein
MECVLKLPWASLRAALGQLLERLAIALLKAASQKAVGGQLGLSWDEIHDAQQRCASDCLRASRRSTARSIG